MNKLKLWIPALALFFIIFAPMHFVKAVSNDHLKYFGYFGDGVATDGTYKDYANVVWLSSNQYDTGICGISPGNDKTCQIKNAVAHGKKVILALQTYLLFDSTPAGYGNLCDPTIVPGCIKDYISNWNDYKQYIKPYVDDGSIIALYLLDEPVLYYGDRDLVRRGIYDTMYEKLDAVTKLIKQDFPNLPLAATLLPSDITKLTGPMFPQQVQKPTGEFIPGFQEPLPIPLGLDWIGFDCYSDWDNCYQTGVSITQLHNALKAKLRPGQKMFLVPDGFLYVDENYHAGDTPSQTGVTSLLTRINNYYELAKNDSDVIAMFPFKWGDTSYDGVGHLYVNGIPQVSVRYEQIGREIVSPVSPVLSFTVSPTTIEYNTASTLTWIISGGKVDSCTIGGAWGPLTQADQQYLSAGTHTQTTGNLKTTSTFTMFCSGPGGRTETQATTVSVKPIPTPVPTPIPTPVPNPTPIPNTTTEAPIPGCSSGNRYNTLNGALCVSAVAQVAIAGCGSRTTGFSTTIGGKSCVGNIVSAATTTKTYNFGPVTLKNGSNGEGVKELQRFLNAKLNLGLVIDGKLGPKTIAVIKTWQKNSGLVADGLVGTKTKVLMNTSVK